MHPDEIDALFRIGAIVILGALALTGIKNARTVIRIPEYEPGKNETINRLIERKKVANENVAACVALGLVMILALLAP